MSFFGSLAIPSLTVLIGIVLLTVNRVATQIHIEFFRGFQGFFRGDWRIFQGSFWKTLPYLPCLVLMIEKWQTFQLKPASQLHNI